jgi:hypothetical protein
MTREVVEHKRSSAAAITSDDITRLTCVLDHMEDCECCREAIQIQDKDKEDKEAGTKPTPTQNAAHKHNPTGELGRECNNE